MTPSSARTTARSSAAVESLGIPRVHDLNDVDADIGAAPFAANIRDGIRWNAAFAYLDPVRDQANLAIAGDAIVDRVELRPGASARVHAIRDGRALVIEAGRVVLTAGAYGTPAILLRSGIGPARDLEQLGIDVVLDLPGVGGNLHDHPMAELDFSGTPALTAALADAASRGFVPEEQTLAKLRSSSCREAFDLHLAPVAAVSPLSLLAGRVLLAVACMAPRSRGRLSLASQDPEQMPVIDHGYLRDPDGADLEVIVDGVRTARELARTEPLASLIGHETGALAGLEDEALREGDPRHPRPLLPPGRHRAHGPRGRSAVGLRRLRAGARGGAAVGRRLRADPDDPASEHEHPGGGRRGSRRAVLARGLARGAGRSRRERDRSGRAPDRRARRPVEVRARRRGESAARSQACKLFAQLGVVLEPVGLDAAQPVREQRVHVVGQLVRAQLELRRVRQHRAPRRCARSARRPRAAPSEPAST